MWKVFNQPKHAKRKWLLDQLSKGTIMTNPEDQLENMEFTTMIG